MPEYSLDSFAGDVGTEGASFLKNTVNKVGNFACSLYKDFPAAMVDTPADAMLRGFWDELCRERPPGLPPVPAMPFLGGQCVCAGYQVNIQYTWTFPNNPPEIRNFSVVLYGPIGGVRLVKPNVDEDSIQVLCRGNYPSPPCAAASFWQDVVIDGSAAILSNVSVQSIVRIDGDDNCGNLPATYPDTPIPPERRTTTIPIPVRPGVTLTVPLVYLSPKLEIPVRFDLGGVNVKFDFDGASIKFGGDVGDSITRVEGDITTIKQDVNTVNNTVNRVEGDVDVLNNTLNKVEGDVTNFGDTVNNINNIFLNAPIPPEQIEEGIPDEVQDKEGLEKLYGVRLKLTEIPSNSKQQFGIAAPNVIYAGWFEFKRGSHCFPREPIAFEEGIFKAPYGADGYAWTVYVGYQAEATVITLKEIEEVEV